MFPRVSVQEASAATWDVVLVGSSFASMFFLRGLPPELSVLIIERGDVVSHATQGSGWTGPDVAPPVDNASNREKSWVVSSIFGGNSNCWWGQTPRFLPADFRTRTLFGVAEDWPFGYEELEPYYAEAEAIMEIAGGGNEHLLPRSRPYPFPPHTPSRSDQALQAFSRNWVPASCARSNGGSRPTCCANGVCHHCPVEAKFTILNSVDRFVRPGAALLTGAEVRSIEHAGGVATAAVIRAGDTQARIAFGMAALGANAIFNAAILLRSGFAAPALGRYLHEQVARPVEIDVAIPNFFGGTSITGLGYHFYHDADRSQRAAVLLENFNVPARARPTRGRWTERLTLKLVAEDIPSADNRVTIVDDEPRIEWRGHSDYGYAGIDHALANIAAVLPAPVENVNVLGDPATEAHIQGTTRMGASIETGVVDDRLRLHEARNLFCLGSGAFPSCSPANPTLTLSALSLRAAGSVA